MSEKNTKAATWAQWRWHRGLGRWHRLFTDGDLSRTACDTPRKNGAHLAEQTAAKPSGTICPICDALDTILSKVMSGEMTDAVATTTVTVTVPDPILVPAGVCVCGAAHCNTEEAIALRVEIDAREQAIRAAKEAAFEAFVASQAVLA